MPQELDKDDMAHREGEVFELSPMLEGDGRESDELKREDEALLSHDDPLHLDVPVETTPIAAEPPAQPSFAKIEYLDGVRGLAAVWVFVQHFMPAYTMNGHEYGFGQDGHNYNFVNFPIVRLMFGNGGNAAVVIFFVLSGYVLSISSFRKLKQDRAPECRRALLSALIRRPLRLYIPPLVISFIDAMLLHVPGPLVLPLPWDGGKPKEGGIWAEIEFFVSKSVDYFSLFRSHASNQFAYPYNSAMWTIPLELKGSLLVFGVVFVLSLGMRGPDHKVPMMAALMLFGAAAIMLQREWKWSMVCFMFGIVLALVDTWPIGAAIKRPFVLPGQVKQAWNRLPAPKWPETPGLITNLLRERLQVLRARATPRWLARRFSRGYQPPREPTKSPGLFPHVCLWVGLYLLSEPSHAGDRTFTTHTPGWVWLSSLIPDEYDDDRYYRYWETWASILVIYAVLRIPYLQRFFSTRPLKFLGYVSFMLYLVHLPWFRILPDRITSLFGGFPDDLVKGSFWDQTWEVPVWGLYGISLRFWCAMSIAFSSSLLLAWVFTKYLDQPSVRLGKRITKRIGLDKPRPTKAATEGLVLPT